MSIYEFWGNIIQSIALPIPSSLPTTPAATNLLSFSTETLDTHCFIIGMIYDTPSPYPNLKQDGQGTRLNSNVSFTNVNAQLKYGGPRSSS